MAQKLHGHVEHRRHPGRIGFAEHPGRLRGEIAVRLADHCPDFVHHLMDRELRHMGAALLKHGVRGREHRRVLGGIGARLRHLPIEVLRDHGERSLRQIAEVVGEIGVDLGRDHLVRVAAVLAEGHFAQEVVAQLVDAVGFREIEGIEHVADGLRHLLALVEQEAVAEDALGQLKTRRHQEGGPVNRVKARDVLADHVHIGGPVFPARMRGVRKAGAGDVIVQRVDPDIHDVPGVARHGQAP